ncbi:MAG: Lrp/AsnC family transcriptional regulator [Phycisphaerae bacterium]|nr:Lrp/AsnC family transcriptional regulator [Phycisphaerae bacterium]
MKTAMDELDTRILSLAETKFPIVARPFDTLAERVGAPAEEVLARLGRLVRDGAVRRIGPVFDSRLLGYVSTLVAARVPEERLPAIAEQVNHLPGVTHNYERRGAYNLWFTLTAASAESLARMIERLGRETDLKLHSLPALAVYKIRAVFADSEGAPHTAPAKQRSRRAGIRLTEGEKELVRALQDNLAPEREPFKAVADRAGWTEADVLRQTEAWLASGVLRRFGAVVGHRHLGYTANGMAVFRVADASVDEAGRALAARSEITHCYRRPPLPDFPYTLYAMIHGRTEDEVSALAARLAGKIGAADHAVLFSVTEFKKSPMRYFEPEDEK